MIAIEEEKDIDDYIKLAEYLASFWNFKAVQQIREQRESREQHAFMSDDEFEKSIREESYKNNPWLDRLREIREAANYNGNDIASRRNRAGRDIKPPTDLSYLASLTEED